MTHDEFISKYNLFQRKVSAARKIFIAIIIGGFIFICTCQSWLKTIGIEWFHFQDKDSLSFILFFVFSLIPLLIFLVGTAWIEKKKPFRCPHCNKSLIEDLPAHLAIASQRCRFCGKILFDKSLSLFPPKTNYDFGYDNRPPGSISIDPAFPNRDEFQKIYPSRSPQKLPRISFLCLFSIALLTPFVLSSIMTKVLFHFHLLPSPEVVVAFFIFNLSGFSYLEGMIFPLFLKKLESETPFCPNCKMSLRNDLPATILFTTSNCCYCGKKLWGENDFTESQRNPAIGQSNKNHERLHPYHETIFRLNKQERTATAECCLAFVILCIISPKLFTYFVPHVSNQTSARVLLSSIVLFLVACFYYVRLSAPKLRCPHCKKDIGERTSIAVVVATGNCCHCGKPVSILHDSHDRF